MLARTARRRQAAGGRGSAHPSSSCPPSHPSLPLHAFRESAAQLAARGAHVVLACRNLPLAERVAAEIRWARVFLAAALNASAAARPCAV